jgi:hypothetical protein
LVVLVQGEGEELIAVGVAALAEELPCLVAVTSGEFADSIVDFAN